jgi:endonuclease G
MSITHHLLLTSLALVSQLAGAACPGITSGRVDMKSTSDLTTTLCKSEFEIAYSTTRKLPLYVVEPEVRSCVIIRNKQFKADSTVSSTQQANKSAYRQSDYDIGHLAAAQNHSCNRESYNETFLFTNAAPQVPNFNRGVWRALEKHVVETYPRAVVFTGVVFPPVGSPTLGKRRIPIPTHFWKIIVSDTSTRAYLFENREYSPIDKYGHFSVSVGEIEKLAHVKLIRNQK